MSFLRKESNECMACLVSMKSILTLLLSLQSLHQVVFKSFLFWFVCKSLHRPVGKKETQVRGDALERRRFEQVFGHVSQQEGEAPQPRLRGNKTQLACFNTESRRQSEHFSEYIKAKFTLARMAPKDTLPQKLHSASSCWREIPNFILRYRSEKPQRTTSEGC